MDNTILTSEFINELSRKASCKEAFILVDSVTLSKPMTRGTCARVVHEFIRKILKEEPAMNWNEASKLKDLYDCHTCVGHIAEVYEKGIMPARRNTDGMLVFEINVGVTKNEAIEIVQRTLEPMLRRVPQKFTNADKNAGKAPIEIGPEILDKWLAVNKTVNLIDVRYGLKSIDNRYHMAKQVDFKEYMDNPYIIVDSEDSMKEALCFFCEEGYKSQMAANLACHAGFEEVYYLALDL